MSCLDRMSIYDHLQASRKITLQLTEVQPKSELVFDSQMCRANLSASLGLTMQEVKNGPPFARDKSFMILLKQEIESKVLKPGIIYTEITLKRALDKINQISAPHVSDPDLLETKDDIDLVKTLEVHQLKWRFTVYRCILQAKDEKTFDMHVLSLTECAICSRIRLIKAIMAQQTDLTQLAEQELEHGLRGTDSCLRNVFINDCLKFIQSLAPMEKAEMEEFLVHKTAGTSRVHAVGDEYEMIAALMKFSDEAFKTLDNPNLQVCIDNRCFNCCQKLGKQAMKVLEVPPEYDIQDQFQPKTDLTRKDVWNFICGPQRGHFNKYQTYLLQNIRVGDMYNRDDVDLLKLWFKLTKRFIVEVELHGNSPTLARLDKLSKDITNEIFADPTWRFLKTIATHHDVDLFQSVQMLFETFLFGLMALTVEIAVRDMDFGVLIVFIAVIAEFFISFNEITQYAVVVGCSELVPTFLAAVKDTFAGPVIAELNETGALDKFCNELIHDHPTEDGIEEEWKDFLVYKKNKRKAIDTAEVQSKKNRPA